MSRQLSRDIVLKIQFIKLVNYHRDELAPEWRLPFETKDWFNSPQFQAFSAFTDIYDWFNSRWWIGRMSDEKPWGPKNCTLQFEPDPSLGDPLELYVGANGVVLTLRRAARFLAIDRLELFQLKLNLIFDLKVVAEAMSRMLKPRPSWPGLSSVRPDL